MLKQWEPLITVFMSAIQVQTLSSIKEKQTLLKMKLDKNSVLVKSNSTKLNFHVEKLKITTTKLLSKYVAIDMQIAQWKTQEDDRSYGRGVGGREQMGREENNL